jgi:molecular chaperone GrpE
MRAEEHKPSAASDGARGDEARVRSEATSEAEADAGREPEAGARDAAPAEARALEQDVEELIAKAAERDEYLALAQRTQADFENYRKRAGKDVAAAESRGVSKLARELLPALDNLSRALAAAQVTERERSEAEEGERHLAEGIKLVHDDLVAALERVGIEAYSPEGEPFDPELHEAMAQQPAEGAQSGTIIEVYEPGYRLNGGVLRAAKVVVAE